LPAKAADKPLRASKDAPVGKGALARPALSQSPAAAVKGKKEKGYDPVAPKRITEILKRLDQLYPDVTCALAHSSAWELLVATILSAQSTDVNVNRVTPELFRKYPTRALGHLDAHGWGIRRGNPRRPKHGILRKYFAVHLGDQIVLAVGVAAPDLPELDGIYRHVACS
jgi:hypothetical protein